MNTELGAAGVAGSEGLLSQEAPPGSAAQDLVREIMDLFNDRLNVAVPSPEADLIATGLLDSLKLVELLFLLEQEFGVKVAIEALDFDTFRTVHDIGLIVGRNRHSKGAASL